MDQTNRVLIFDTTLRDGEQSPGISLNTAEKLEIAHQLARLGVDVIEAGFPITSPGDFEAVQAIAREVEGPVIAGLARTQPPTSTRAWNAVRDAERPRIHTFISTSDIHIEHQLQTTREDVKGQARAAVAHAKRLRRRRRVLADGRHARRRSSSPPRCCQIAIDEGATTINIPDTVGYTMPQEYAAYLERLYELVPGAARRRAVGPLPRRPRAGGRQLVRRRAGRRAPGRVRDQRHRRAGGQRVARGDRDAAAHAPEPTSGCAPASTRREIARTSRLVSRLTGYSVQPNKAIVGRNAFAHESGIHQDGVLKERTTYEIMDATHRRASTPTRSCWASTPAATRCSRRCEELGFEVSGQALNTGVQALQGDRGQEEAGHRDGPRGARDRRAARRRSPATRSSGSTSRPPRAGRRTRRSACARPTARRSTGYFTGDGPVDAIFRAINAATRQRRAAARVPRRRGDRRPGRARRGLGRARARRPVRASGQGVSTDIIEAAGRAYVRALSNAVREAVARGGRRGDGGRASSSRAHAVAGRGRAADASRPPGVAARRASARPCAYAGGRAPPRRGRRPSGRCRIAPRRSGRPARSRATSRAAARSAERLDAAAAARDRGAQRPPRAGRRPGRGRRSSRQSTCGRRGPAGAASRFVGLQTPPSTYSRPPISTGAKSHGIAHDAATASATVGRAARPGAPNTTRRPRRALHRSDRAGARRSARPSGARTSASALSVRPGRGAPREQRAAHGPPAGRERRRAPSGASGAGAAEPQRTAHAHARARRPAPPPRRLARRLAGAAPGPSRAPRRAPGREVRGDDRARRGADEVLALAEVDAGRGLEPGRAAPVIHASPSDAAGGEDERRRGAGESERAARGRGGLAARHAPRT